MIKFIGLDDFDEDEYNTLTSLIKIHHKKMRNKQIKDFELIIHAKKHFKSGKAAKYSLTARIDAPNLLLTASAADWNLKKTSHEVMKKLEAEFTHKFKKNTSYRKPYF